MTLYALAMFAGHITFTLTWTLTPPRRRHDPHTLDHYLLPTDLT
ncbi:hypothetical protein [Actinomadura sp. GTD37]